MKDISAGLTHNNYIGSRKIRGLFRGLPYRLEIKDINVNGQKRGCSGFITNTETGSVCYITTEPFFDGKGGSGLYNDKQKSILMRSAKNTKDYVGGANRWLAISDVVDMADKLTNPEGIVAMSIFEQ